MPGEIPAGGLRGRSYERAVVERLLAGVQTGQSRVLVVRGEAGVGKTSLLGYLISSATAFRVARTAGVESEMELPYAALEQLCAPLMERLVALPDPQRQALEVAFGLGSGTAPDRFLVGLAVLNLFCAAADNQPLLCVVDDAHWLDRATAQTLAFVGRRLLADPVGMVFATRDRSDELAGLPGLTISGLGERDAQALLDSVVGVSLDHQIRERIVAEAHGNPLALLEWARGMTPSERAGGIALSNTSPLSGLIEEGFSQQLAQLPPPTQQFLVVVAAEPTGDPVLVWSAAARLGIGDGAAAPALAVGLIELDTRVIFRHPLVRSATYRSASFKERQDVHRALAEATDPEKDPDRRAWQLAQASSDPDEEVATELERSSGRALARGGLAAAAALLERSAVLTVNRARRVERVLAAAQVNVQAGAFDTALRLLNNAQAGAMDEFQSARTDLLRGRIAFASRMGHDAPLLLLQAAESLAALDVTLARETYLDAFRAAQFSGHLATGVTALDVSRAARSAPRPIGPARLSDIVLDALAVLMTDGVVSAAPTLRDAVSAFRSGRYSTEEQLKCAWICSLMSIILWDFEAWAAICARDLELARKSGALGLLPMALMSGAVLHARAGDFQDATALIEECEAIADATGSRLVSYGTLLLTSLRSAGPEAFALIESAIDEARAIGQGVTVQFCQVLLAILSNGLGRYQEALANAREASNNTPELYIAHWALPELVEGAVRSGNTAAASEALERVEEIARACATDWALGMAARSRALATTGDAADHCYRLGIEHLSRTSIRPDLARAHLLYGEWLRRENRRTDARQQLRTAYNMLATMGMEAFAARARRELQATGETVQKRRVEARNNLTPQEAHIARLAAQGHTNSEIGGQLFLSANTVDYHLRKVFTKLGIRSRTQLQSALAKEGPALL